MQGISSSAFANWEKIWSLPEYGENNRLKSWLTGYSSGILNPSPETKKSLYEALRNDITATHENYVKNNQCESKSMKKDLSSLLQRRLDNYNTIKTLSHEIHNFQMLGHEYCSQLLRHLIGASPVPSISQHFYGETLSDGIEAVANAYSIGDSAFFEESLNNFDEWLNPNSDASMLLYSLETPIPPQELNHFQFLATQQQPESMVVDSMIVYNHHNSPGSSAGYYSSDQNKSSDCSSSSAAGDNISQNSDFFHNIPDCDNVDLDYFHQSPEDLLQNPFVYPISNEMDFLSSEVSKTISKTQDWIIQQRVREYDNESPELVSLDDLEAQICEILRRLLDAYKKPLVKEEAKKLIRTLVKELLIIVIQPNQKSKRVIQYQQNFTAVLRLLIPIKMILSENPVLNMCILNQENQIPVHVSLTQNIKFEQDKDGHYVAELHLTIPKNPIRKDKNKANDTNMKSNKDENFWINFNVYIFLDGFEEGIELNTTSLPFKIIVGSPEVMKASSTLVFDNAAQYFYGKIENRPKQVIFPKLIKALRTHFPNLRLLSDQDFYTIARIIFNDSKSPDYFQGMDPSQKMISLHEFRHEREIPSLNTGKNTICYWEWIYIMDHFIGKYFGDSIWWPSAAHNYTRIICGYMNSDEMYARFGNCREGSFCVRFSNSTPNAVSVEYIDKKGMFVSYRGLESELIERSLKNRILDVNEWKIHYPTLRKKGLVFGNEALQNGFHYNANDGELPPSFYQQPIARRRGLMTYVKAFLRMSLE